MNTSKHTQGPYENTGVTLFAGVNAVSRTTEIVHICTLDDRRPTEEELANGRLVEEAFVVAAETGLTPRQLADQRAQLLQAAARASKCIKNAQRGHDATAALHFALQELELAIANVEGRA